jgi:hypothetical protein
VFALALALGGTKYAYNLAVHHELLVANGSARSGFDVFSLGERSANLRYYDFHSLKLNEAALLFAPEHGGGTLTAQPVYASVWTTLHAMAWTDMSFFSVHARHGDPSLPYPEKRVSVPLVRLLLYLGLVPTVLCMVGLVSSAFRKSLWPLSFFALSSFSTYLWWFLAQDCWALKTKYLLFLLPVYVLFALLGLHRALRVCGRFGRGIALVSVALLSSLLVTCVAYLTSFALG